MDIPNWQNIAVVVAVFAALVYLCVRAYGVVMKRKRTGCGAGCNTCPSAAPEDKVAKGSVVSIEQFTASANQLRPRSPK